MSPPEGRGAGARGGRAPGRLLFREVEVREPHPEELHQQSRLVQAALSVLDGYGAATVRTALPVGASPPWLAQAGFGPAARFEVRVVVYQLTRATGRR